MTASEYKQLQNYVHEINSIAKSVIMKPSEVIFEECVKMNCYYCGKYNNNWKCPPNIPNINYKKMFREYDDGMFIFLEYDIPDSSSYSFIRNESSVTLHKTLLAVEKFLWEHNHPTAISFVGGSCKLCKGGCGKEKCNNPYLARSPLEAVGVNVIKTAKKYGIKIYFPTEKHLMRIGLVMWQN